MKKEIEKLIYLAGILDIKGFTKESVELDNIISKMAASKLLRTLTLKKMDLSSDSNLKIPLNAFLYQAGVKPGGLNRHDVIDQFNDSFEFHEVQVGLGKYYLTAIEIDSDAVLVFDPSSQEWKSGRSLSKPMMSLLVDIYKDFNRHISFSSINGFQQVSKQTVTPQHMVKSPVSQISSNTMTFDFGQGPVPAKQHPNGKGWVADTAIVAPTAFVGGSAEVYGKAIVDQNAKIFDHAKVFGEAKVTHDATISGTALVFGNAIVDFDTLVGGNSEVSGQAWITDAAVIMNSKIKDNAHIEGTAYLVDCEAYNAANVKYGYHDRKTFK